MTTFNWKNIFKNNDFVLKVRTECWTGLEKTHYKGPDREKTQQQKNKTKRYTPYIHITICVVPNHKLETQLLFVFVCDTLLPF